MVRTRGGSGGLDVLANHVGGRRRLGLGFGFGRRTGGENERNGRGQEVS
jgi:hypothetical protein